MRQIASPLALLDSGPPQPYSLFVSHRARSLLATATKLNARLSNLNTANRNTALENCHVHYTLQIQYSLKNAQIALCNRQCAPCNRQCDYVHSNAKGKIYLENWQCTENSETWRRPTFILPCSSTTNGIKQWSGQLAMPTSIMPCTAN